ALAGSGDRERGEARREDRTRRGRRGDRRGSPGGARMSEAKASAPAARAVWVAALRVRRPRRRAAVALPPVVYRWDLDKTYLKSDFESLTKMMRVPFERAEEKIDKPGVVALMRALRASARAEGRRVYVYFVSASPPQIAPPLRQK